MPHPNNNNSFTSQLTSPSAALRIAGNQWTIEGPMTFDSVAQLETTLDTTLSNPDEVDLAATTEVDSSAVALLVAIKRRHPNVQFKHVPAPLTQLADVYGVRDLIL
jgi:ABC-type transporter Mla MlaB component